MKKTPHEQDVKRRGFIYRKVSPGAQRVLEKAPVDVHLAKSTEVVATARELHAEVLKRFCMIDEVSPSLYTDICTYLNHLISLWHIRGQSEAVFRSL